MQNAQRRPQRGFTRKSGSVLQYAIVGKDEPTDDERGAGSPAGTRFLLLSERQYHARNDRKNIAQPQT